MTVIGDLCGRGEVLIDAVFVIIHDAIYGDIAVVAV